MSDSKARAIALMEAMTEAERFISKAKVAYSKLRTDEYAHFGCKETAAAKRASMDLTRALVAVRNPYRD